MCENILLFAIVCSVFCSASAVTVPFITKCVLSDSECLKQNTVNAIPIFAGGIPELGVEQLDPLHIPLIDASTPNLKLIISDATLVGLKQCDVQRIQIDKENSKMYLSLECTVDMHGKYDLDGKILFLQVQGNGNAHSKLRNAHFDFVCDFITKEGKDGKMHYSLKNTKYTYELKGKADLELDNLFQGDEVLGRAARELFETSPNEIVQEIAPPIFKYIVNIISKNVNHFFRAAPIEDIEIL